ncbi:unnamed protein product [Amoebophrya sp. A120]|nr:unnamed protein product [Amoebophrya sp. A120]|eukprot:GSA120T00010688001.1
MRTGGARLSHQRRHLFLRVRPPAFVLPAIAAPRPREPCCRKGGAGGARGRRDSPGALFPRWARARFPGRAPFTLGGGTQAGRSSCPPRAPARLLTLAARRPNEWARPAKATPARHKSAPGSPAPTAFFLAGARAGGARLVRCLSFSLSVYALVPAAGLLRAANFGDGLARLAATAFRPRGPRLRKFATRYFGRFPIAIALVEIRTQIVIGCVLSCFLSLFKLRAL